MSIIHLETIDMLKYHLHINIEGDMDYDYESLPAQVMPFSMVVCIDYIVLVVLYNTGCICMGLVPVVVDIVWVGYNIYIQVDFQHTFNIFLSV